MEVLQHTYKDTIFRRLLGEIPNDWSVKEISDFTKFSQGVQVNVESQFSSPSNELIRFIRIVDYTQSTDDIRYISKSYSKYIVNENDIVMIRYGTPGVIGRSIKGVIANNMFKISIDNSLSTNDYFEYFFKQKHIQEYLLMGSGSSTMPALNFSYLKKFQIALPPLPEQQKIAAILSTVDEQISTTDKIIEKSKELKKGLMQKLFSEGIGHTEFKDTKIGRIPKDWGVVRLEEVLAEFQNGYAFSSKGYQKIGIPIVSMAYIGLEGKFNFNYNKANYWSEEERENLSRYLLKEEDLIIAMTDVTPKKNLIGRMVQIDIDDEFFLNQRVGLLRCNNKIDKKFLMYLGNSKFWRRYAIGHSTLGVQTNLGTKEIKKGRILLPPLSEQKKIAEILSEADAKIEKEEIKKKKLEQLKRGLMQQLLTGKKRVKV